MSATLAPSAIGRRHRVHLPPPVLPRRLTVDEKEWSVQPSETIVGAGTVTFRGYNRGQDRHDLAVIGSAGSFGMISLAPGASGTVTAHLPPGTYHLICPLYAGTPQSHEALGMHATLTVR